MVRILFTRSSSGLDGKIFAIFSLNAAEDSILIERKLLVTMILYTASGNTTITCPYTVK
jgi:hypothetical protein